MRIGLDKLGHELLKKEVGDKIFRIWFNRWTTKLSVSKEYYRSRKTHWGDISQYYRAFEKLGYLDKTTNEYPCLCSVKDKKTKWKKYNKKIPSFRLNLNPFFEYLEREKKIQLNDFDKHIITLIFESEKNRGKMINLGKDYFTSIKEIIFDYLRLPLGEIKTELLDYWTTETHRVEAYINYLNGIREKITFQEFKKMEKEIEKGRIFVYGSLIGKSKENKIYQMILHVSNSFIKKMVKASTPQPLY